MRIQQVWRGYSAPCGEVTKAVARLPVARLQSGYSLIFRWNQQHFNYILVSVARFLPYFI